MVDFPASHGCSPPSPSHWRRAHAVRLPTHLGRVEGHHWRTRWRTRSHPALLGQTPTINFCQQKELNWHELSWAIVLERLCLILGCRHYKSFQLTAGCGRPSGWNSNAKINWFTDIDHLWQKGCRMVQGDFFFWLRFRNFCWPSFLVPSALYLQQFGTRICHFARYLLHFGMVTLHFAWYVLHLAMFAFHFAWCLPRFGTSTWFLESFCTVSFRASLGFHLGFHIGFHLRFL